MHRIFLFVIAIVFLSCTSSFAQVLKGKVLDEKSLDPIPFVNVVYSEGAGTVTDIDGRFEIRTNAEITSLKISCLGYEPKQMSIEEFYKSKEIKLRPLKYSLPTVDVLPTENPAIAIMRKVVANKDQHNPDNYNPFSCVMYHKMTLDFDYPVDLSKEEIDELKDSLGLNNDSYLFLFESVSEKKHLKKGVGKEKVISGRVSGLKDPLLASFPAILQPFSFYGNYIKLLGYQYLNPASRAGISSYQFILEETITEANGDSVFYISYRPKADRSFRGLKGAFHIDSQSMAIKTVSATTMGVDNGMRLFIRQKYQLSDNGLWFPLQLESSLQFGSLGAARRLPFPILGKGKSYVTAINTEPQFDPKEFDNVILEGISDSKNAPDVAQFRYEPLTARDSLTYHFLDSIGRKNHLDALIKTQISMVKGYLPMGKLQLDLSKLIDYNDYEGLQLGAGIYTSSRLSENFTTGGYYTYGFSDKASKYGLELSVNPFVNKENKAYIKYQDDVQATGSIEFLDGVKALSSERFGRFLTETMDLSEGYSAGVEFRFLRYLKAGLEYSDHEVTPLRSYHFSENGNVAEAFEHQEGKLKLKWAQKETFTNSPLGKISNGTKWPVVWVNTSFGRWKTDQQFDYTSFEGRIHKQFNYPNSMYTILRLEGGYLNGDYNPTLLYSALGSYKSFTVFVPYTFGTMRLNEFAASEFGALYFSHGMPLGLNTENRIKPEIVLSTNVAFGEAPDGFKSISKGYYESGFYLKNLFSNFIFQYGLSVHYRYGTYRLPDAIDNWAFKLGLEFAF